jgi:hypothetical protein
MQHIRRSIEDLRRYIASSTARAELEEVDALLAVALEEVRRKLVVEAHKDQRRETGRR